MFLNKNLYHFTSFQYKYILYRMQIVILVKCIDSLVQRSGKSVILQTFYKLIDFMMKALMPKICTKSAIIFLFQILLNNIAQILFKLFKYIPKYIYFEKHLLDEVHRVYNTYINFFFL